MKEFKFAFVLTAFLGLIYIGCSDESQSPVSPADQVTLEKNIIHYFTLTEVPLPPPYDVDPGVKIYLPNRDRYYKALGGLEYTESKDMNGNIDPLVTGVIENYLTTMIDGETGDGPAHGVTISRRAPGEEALGIWETEYKGYRSYVGKQNLDLPIGPGEYHVWTLPYRMLGNGKGGVVDNMQMYLEGTVTVFSDDATFTEPIFWMGSASGFYIEH